VLMRSFKQAPKQKSNRMTYDQVRPRLLVLCDVAVFPLMYCHCGDV
jgi:hypothetical protein